LNYITFAFDDGYRSWGEAGELLEKYGWRGTFYTCLRNVVYIRKDGRKRMFPLSDVITWDELKTLKQRGHEIACHGTRHIDLKRCDEREVKMELVDSLEVFKSHRFNVTTYGCAFNSYPRFLPDFALEHYNSFRDWVGENKYPITSRIYHVQRSGEAYESLLNGDNKWVVSTWHDITDSGFKKYLKKISEMKNVKVKTVKWMYANAFKGN